MASDDLPVTPARFGVYLYEPNPKFTKILRQLKTNFGNIIAVSQKAAWISDGEKKFALDHNTLAYGSTLMESKVESWQAFKKITVDTFDFSKSLKPFRHHYLIVKMDIEGAEFPILEKMIIDGTDVYMNQLWIEVHPNKVRDYTTGYALDLIERIKKRGVKVTLWH
jgi:FkbM family methyltransferase